MSRCVVFSCRSACLRPLQRLTAQSPAETSLLTASRFILLDPILLFFIQGAIMAMFWFRAQRDR